MSEPVDLATERERRNPKRAKQCPDCGGTWWTVEAVTVSPTLSVTAWAAPLSCRACGHVLVDNQPMPPELEVIS